MWTYENLQVPQRQGILRWRCRHTNELINNNPSASTL